MSARPGWLDLALPSEEYKYIGTYMARREHKKMTTATAKKQLLVELNPELVKRLKKRLIDDELTYKAWVEQRIREYLISKKGGQR